MSSNRKIKFFPIKCNTQAFMLVRAFNEADRFIKFVQSFAEEGYSLDVFSARDILTAQKRLQLILEHKNCPDWIKATVFINDA